MIKHEMRAGKHNEMSKEDNEIKCWHKEIDQDGICKNCGARAAIELEGLHSPGTKSLDMLRVSHSPEEA